MPVTYGQAKQTRTLSEWMVDDEENGRKSVGAQSVFQSAPPDTKTGYDPNVGLYPLGVAATKKAADRYNAARPADQQVTVPGFQVVTWYAVIAANPSGEAMMVEDVFPLLDPYANSGEEFDDGVTPLGILIADLGWKERNLKEIPPGMREEIARRQRIEAEEQVDEERSAGEVVEFFEEDQHPVAMAAEAAANQRPTKRGYIMSTTGDADADADRLIDAILADVKADKEAAAAAKPQD